MFGKGPPLDPLETRKELLIAESELNRAQLSQEWQAMAHAVGALTHRVSTLGAWVSAAVLLVAGFAALRTGPPARGAAKRTWFQKILNSARMASTIWVALPSRRHKPDRPEP
jgi:hypothetical protein